MAKRILCFFVVFQSLNCLAATVDTLVVYSTKMHKNIPCVVIRPDAYKIKNAYFPVLYLLHGYSGNYSNWVNKVPDIKKEADLYGMMIVCPDGAFSGWYMDSPVDSSMQYESFIADELPHYIDKHYRTINSSLQRAIAGLSMGGYGALMISFRHSDIFGACGSISGAVNLSSIRDRFDVVKRFGDSATHAEVWKKYYLMNIVEQYAKASAKQNSLAIIMDCGTSDFFSKDNKALHARLTELGIAHDYIERPGNHDWNYWANSIQYQLLFFHNYFKQSFGRPS